jgi:uncharacterized membrane protein
MAPFLFFGQSMRDYTVVVKWCSAIIILIAMVFHVMGITPWNSILQLIAAAGWTYVGYKWNERAIIMNFLPQFFIIIPGLIYLYCIK